MSYTTYPASEKQISYVQSLMAQRVVPAGFDWPENPTGKEATAAIDLLKSCPRIEQKLDKPLVQTGYYLLDVQVYVVVKSKGSDRRYAKRQILNQGKQCSWEYDPGAIIKLEHALPLTLEEAIQFGGAHGYCVACGRAIPKSAAKGIGPVCAKKFSL